MKQPRIYMKAGYRFFDSITHPEYDCVIVYNYASMGIIELLKGNEKRDLQEYKNSSMIGIWRIKKTR